MRTSVFQLRTLLAGVALLFGASHSTAGGEFGTAAEAKAMLAKAVENIKANEAGSLAEIQKVGLGSRDRDHYVFCG